MEEREITQTISCSLREVVADYACAVGENPIWHSDEESVLWTDIPAGRLFRYRPAENSHEIIYKGRPVGGFTIQADGSLLLFKDRGTITHWRDNVESVVVSDIAEEHALRFNDVIADPRGRVFCGTYAEGLKGRLYRLDTDGTLTKLLDGIGCSNGLAFTLDRKGLFYVDSFSHNIYCFDYDEVTGSISNQRVFHHVPAEQGFADGCTVDAEGCLWFAMWGGSSIVRLNGVGEVIQSIMMPARRITSLSFGGTDLRNIYVTSEGGSDRTEPDLLAGAIFRVRCSVAGKPEYRSCISIPAYTKTND